MFVEVARGARGRAFGALCCQREHPTPKRLSRFWRNPDLRTQNWDIGAFLLAHSPLGATRQRRLFPGNPSLPPSKEVLAGAGLRTGRLQGTEHWGSKPPRVKLIINLCWWEPVARSTPLALGIVRELGRRRNDPGLRLGNASCGGSRTYLSGLGRTPGAKVSSSSPPNKFLVN